DICIDSIHRYRNLCRVDGPCDDVIHQSSHINLRSGKNCVIARGINGDYGRRSVKNHVYTGGSNCPPLLLSPISEKIISFSRNPRRCAVKAPVVLVACTPLTVIAALGSSTVPVTVIELLLNRSSDAGEVMVSFGPCRLTVMEDDAVLPATSVACTLMVSEPCVICTE